MLWIITIFGFGCVVGAAGVVGWAWIEMLRSEARREAMALRRVIQ